jgi:hypothetical protein
VRMRTLLLFISLLLCLLLLIQVGGAGGHDTRPNAEQQGWDYSLKPCTEGFAHFHVGSSFQGHPLKDHSRICTKADPERTSAAGGEVDPDSLGRSNFDSYVYGTCEPKGGEACAPPLEIQSWPACERSAADYNAGLPGAAHLIAPVETLQLRGVPVRLYADASLELSTRAVTVVIWGHSREQLLAAAKALRTEPGAPFQARPQEELPAPVPGSQTGTLSC